MTPSWFLRYHDVPELVHRWLAGLGVRDTERGARDLADLTRRAGPEGLDLVARIAVQLDALLPRCADPGMALLNLDRFIAAVPRIGSMLIALAENARTTEILVQVFSTSQYLTEVLIRRPSYSTGYRPAPNGAIARHSLMTFGRAPATSRVKTRSASAAAISPARDPAHRLQRHRARVSPWR